MDNDILFMEVQVRMMLKPRQFFHFVAISSFLLCGACGEVDPVVNESITTHGDAIVGGSNANIADHPWQVDVRTINGDQYCGGSILSDQWILTAQHCVNDKTAAELRVSAGASRLSEMSTLGQIRNVKEIILHPCFDESAVQGSKDIALLRLAAPLNFNGNVNAITRATPADQTAGLMNPGILATVSGWGRLSDQGSLTDILQSVQVPIVSNAAAAAAYPTHTITADQLAAGDTVNGGVDACQGDSGGPLTVPKGSSEILAGVVSWGDGCGSAAHPGMYARVASFNDWLNAMMAPAATGREVHIANLHGNGADEIFRYHPTTAQAIMTTFNGGLSGFTNTYNYHGWGIGWEMHFADLDGDGHDEVFRYLPSTGQVIVTQFTANCGQNTYNGTGWGIDWEMHFVDLNGDGKAEVFRYLPSTGQTIVTSFNASLSSFTNTYNGLGWGTNWQMHFADLNGDGKAEVFRYLPATGQAIVTSFNASLSSFTNTYNGLGWDINGQVHFADLDGNGTKEVFRYVPATGQAIVTVFNAALNGFSNTYNGVGWGTNWQVHFADLNGDGDDEVFRYLPSTSQVIVTAFNPTLTGFSNTYSGNGWGIGWEMHFGDLNGDGRDEVFRYLPSTGQAIVTSFQTTLNAFTNTYNGTGW